MKNIYIYMHWNYRLRDTINGCEEEKVRKKNRPLKNIRKSDQRRIRYLKTRYPERELKEETGIH